MMLHIYIQLKIKLIGIEVKREQHDEGTTLKICPAHSNFLSVVDWFDDSVFRLDGTLSSMLLKPLKGVAT